MGLAETFSAPADPDAYAKWDEVMRAADALLATIRECVPPGKLHNEAVIFAKKSAMVANGAFHEDRG